MTPEKNWAILVTYYKNRVLAYAKFKSTNITKTFRNTVSHNDKNKNAYQYNDSHMKGAHR